MTLQAIQTATADIFAHAATREGWIGGPPTYTIHHGPAWALLRFSAPGLSGMVTALQAKLATAGWTALYNHPWAMAAALPVPTDAEQYEDAANAIAADWARHESATRPGPRYAAPLQVVIDPPVGTRGRREVFYIPGVYVAEGYRDTPVPTDTPDFAARLGAARDRVAYRRMLAGMPRRDAVLRILADNGINPQGLALRGYDDRTDYTSNSLNTGRGISVGDCDVADSNVTVAVRGSRVVAIIDGLSLADSYAVGYGHYNSRTVSVIRVGASFAL